MVTVRYTYTTTDSVEMSPRGEGWEYWSDRVVLGEQGQEVERAAVWRRDADVYGYPEDEQ